MKRTCLLILHSLLVTLSPTLLFSQNEQLIELQIESDVYDTTRQVTIYLPTEYFEGTTKLYPVAYLFDGDFEPYLLMTSGVMEYYSQTEESIAMIIVSIHHHNRHEELIPMDQSQDISSHYGAEKLSDHLREEVIPFVESSYRTNAFRFGVGHSLGGSYVLNELFEENSLFKAVIAASPNLNLDNEQLISKVEYYLMANPETYKYAYVSAGDQGDMELRFKSSIDKLDAIIQGQNLPNFDWNYDRMDNENHMTTFLRTYDDGLNHLSRKWWIADEEVMKLVGAKDLSSALKTCLSDHGSFTGEKLDFTFGNIQKIIRKLAQLGEYETAIAAMDFAKESLSEENEENSKEAYKWIENITKYYLFYIPTSKAEKAFDNQDYKKASKFYLVAMEMEVLNGTHIKRLMAVRSFAQTGHIEEAFKQLSLLEKKFGWRGRGVFENDSFMKPLHEDPRWEKLMKQFDEN